jgi:hypothetical protein
MRIGKWIGIIIGFFILVYGGWVLVAMTRVPTISVDYVALLNEKTSALPEHERAWPFYRTAGIALRHSPMPSNIFWEEEIDEPTWPTQEGWNHFDDWIEYHADSLESLYEGSRKTGFGLLLSGQVSDADKDLWPSEYASQQSQEPHDGFVITILLPQYGQVRQMAQLLSIDAKVAAVAGDADRCLQDIESMLRLGTHVREHPLLISDLVSHSIYRMTFNTIAQIMEHEPTLFTSEQFSTLEQDLSMLENHLIIRLEGERYFMLDLLQRTYTDDGNGDGSLVPNSVVQSLGITQTVSLGGANFGLTPPYFAPLADIFHASRKELEVEFQKRMDFADGLADIPLFELKANPNLWVQPWVQRSPNLFEPYFLVDLLAPGFEQAMLQAEYTRANRDATIAILYAVQFHTENGEWPRDVTDAGVLDAWSGKPLLMTEVDGSPVLYSVGFDQEDDGGLFDSQAGVWDVRSTGDWIIWPRPE